MDLKSFRYSGKPDDEQCSLASFDPTTKAGLERETAEAETVELLAKLDDLQQRLYADGSHKVLVVLQAIDGGGKDSTIRRIFGALNPAGVRIASFKAPTEPELAHDYLWRVHAQVPGKGDLVVFNRSHYEDVLIVRVHKIVPQDRWSKRYHHIREFEQLLVDEGTTVVKIFLNLSKDEQAERMRDRIEDPTKHWKFRAADLEERKLWDDYQAAFEAMINKTSHPAPWWVVPADRKWVRDRIIAQVMVEALEALGLQWPEPEPGLESIVVE